MNKKERNYDVHGAVKFRIVDKTNLLSRILSNIKVEYKNFESDEIDNPDFTVYLGNFTPSNQGCGILDNGCYVKPNYFYCEDSYKTAKWGFEMSGFESGDMEVRISINPFAGMLISGFLIDPIINLKLTESGYSLVHASCVGKGNRAHLFTAQGGGGKTSTALYSVEMGYNLLGDNFTILDKGHAMSFLSPLNIFSFNMHPIVERNMGLRTKTEFHLKNLLYRLSGLRLVTKIDAGGVFAGSLTSRSRLESVFLLIPAGKFNIVELDKKELIGHMIANQKLDSFPFLKYMMEYSLMFPESRMSTHWDRYELNLRRNLADNISVYKVEVPLVYDSSTFKKIWEVIQDNASS